MSALVSLKPFNHFTVLSASLAVVVILSMSGVLLYVITLHLFSRRLCRLSLVMLEPGYYLTNIEIFFIGLHT